MKLKLTPLPPTVLGIYGASKSELPERMRYLHPTAAASYLKIDAGPYRLRVSDMWRSAEASAAARRDKRGVQPPGHSGHNYGFCIDLDVDWVLKEHRWSKERLDGFMNEQGWFCHRKDHSREIESWHYNFFGEESASYLAAAERSSSTSPALERKIQAVYGDDLTVDGREAQVALQKLKHYAGEIDGELGPKSTEAVIDFQRKWDLPGTGKLDANTQRLLAFMTSEREIVALAG